MRLRRTDVRTGHMLTCFDPTVRSRNRSLLFLVGGMYDAEMLAPIRQACGPAIEKTGAARFRWLDVADEADLASIEPDINPTQVQRIEAGELADVEPADLERLLTPAVHALTEAGDGPLFPDSSGAGGFPVEGVQFLDRRQELAELVTKVEEGRDLVLQAPRRSGKTSLLRRLAHELRDRRRAEYWDLERHETPEDNVALLWSRMNPEVSFRAARTLARESWSDLLRQALVKLVDGASTSGRCGVVLLVDELAYLLRNLSRRESEQERAQRAGELLERFVGAFDGLPVTFVLAGSEPLEGRMADLGLELESLPARIRTAHRFSLPPMTPDDTALELRRLLLGSGIVATPEDHRWLAEHVDLALPYPALELLDAFAERLRRGRELATDELGSVLTDFLDTTDAFADLQRHLEQRVIDSPGAREAAEAALDLLAAAEPELGAKGDAVLEATRQHAPDKAEALLAWLEATFPLARQGDRVLLRAKLFRAWWRHLGGGGV